jgi:amidohydrolase
VLVNDEALTARVRPSLERIAGAGRVVQIPYLTSAEDFAYYAQRVPSLFFQLGVTPPGSDMAKVAGVHSPRFKLDEAALPIGLRAMLGVAVDYLQGTKR